MATGDAFETELGAYREQVERPLWRLFRAYTQLWIANPDRNLVGSQGEWTKYR
ncbi:hypothetical protein [Natronomonas sp. EA1]|uniref:hypothetical protein n=1 Tax=Natronomonas sp. EA1 TaxID=3421655 RepID=UPI003EB8CE31